MANWLLDYIEMTEYIPSELREQLTSIRELDLQVHNAMDELERDIKQFFSKIHTLSQQERQEQYGEFLKKCDVATRAASDKVKVADKLHDLVEKSMRLLDQGLEKLKEDLLEGDKAYIVEDLERKSQELDEQLKLEHENMIQRQQKLQELKTTHSKGQHHNNHNKLNNESNSNNSVNSQNNHRLSLPCHNQTQNNTNHHRVRNNSTGGTTNPNSAGRQRKRERKRLNSTMSIFNRNSRGIEDESTSQTFLSSPLTPDYITSMQNSSIRSLNDVAGSNNSSLTLKGMMTGNINLTTTTGINDKSNGNNNPSVGAKQPILTAIDAAHAVSPNATNSDKLVLFSSNANGDKYNLTHNITNDKQLINHSVTTLNATQQHPYQHNQLSSHLLSTIGFNHSGVDSSTLINNSAIGKSGGDRYHDHHHNQKSGTPFSGLPLSSRHDPIMMAASQAINATQNMTPGRRTSSLKASYAAVNSGRLQTAPPSQQMFDQQGGLIQEVYCRCRSHIQGSNMIACDNTKCKIEWFHYECVGITTPPEGEWYCDECRVSLNIKQNTNKQPKLEGVNVT